MLAGRNEFLLMTVLLAEYTLRTAGGILGETSLIPYHVEMEMLVDRLD